MSCVDSACSTLQRRGMAEWRDCCWNEGQILMLLTKTVGWFVSKQWKKAMLRYVRTLHLKWKLAMVTSSQTHIPYHASMHW